MLGFLKGRVLSKHEETHQCIVLAHRVGYEVSVPRNLFERLTIGQPTELWLHTHVREDLLVLYGFSTEAEKYFFRTLLTVSGLGPKTAMSLLTEHGTEKLFRLILDKEVDEISQAPGVGKKLAQRLILDLTSKMEKLALLQMIPKGPKVEAFDPFASPVRRMREDLSSALTNLGYAPNQVKTTLERLFEREEVQTLGFEACLKQALKEMSGRSLPSAEGLNA